MSRQTESMDQVTTPDTEKVNWLKGWGEITFKADPDNAVAIKNEQDQIRWYVRGYLEERNDRREREADGKSYRFVRFEKFQFIRVSRSPLRFKVRAFLYPSARIPEHHHEVTGTTRGDVPPTGGSHVIPHPPPKPGSGLG